MKWISVGLVLCSLGVVGCSGKEKVEDQGEGSAVSVDQFSNRGADSGFGGAADSTESEIDDPEFGDFGVDVPGEAEAVGEGKAYVRDTPKAVETRYELTSESKLEDVESFYLGVLKDSKANRMGSQSLVTGKTGDGKSSIVTLEEKEGGGTLIRVEVLEAK